MAMTAALLEADQAWARKQLDLKRVRALVKVGLLDVQIAERLGVCPKTVGRYRAELGLERNHLPNARLSHPRPWQRKAGRGAEQHGKGAR